MVKVAFLLFSTTVIPSLISCTIVKQLIKHGESRKQCVHLHLSLCRYTALLCHRTTEQRSLEGTYRHRPVQPLLQAGCSGPRPGRFWLSPNSTSPLGNLWQPLTTLPLNKKQKNQTKKRFLLLLCGIVPITLPLVTTEQSLALLSLLPPHQVFMHMDKIPPGWAVPAFSASSRTLWSLNHLQGPFLDTQMCVPVSHAGQSRTRHSSPGKAASAASRGEASPPSACWQCLLTPPHSPEKTFLNREKISSVAFLIFHSMVLNIPDMI